MSTRIGKLISEYRRKKISGKCIELIPFTLNDLENVVKIRNKDRNMYFLNQTRKITTESQYIWYKKYLIRNNDIYWCIYNKKNEFIGTIRIYDIDEKNNICDQGSFIIDEKHTANGPYALEAEILTLDFVFDILNIENVINEDRINNKVMNNLTKKLGFDLRKITKINDVEYNYYILNRNNYIKNKNKFMDVIDYWATREIQE